MPLTEDVDVTDNLVVHFGSQCEAVQTFTVIIANRGKQSITVQKISSSLDFIGVVNFNESNSVITANEQISYLFEAKNEQPRSSDLNEAKIRFTFKGHTHVTRRMKIIYETDGEMSVPPQIADTKKDESGSTNASLSPGIINLQGFIKRDFDNWSSELDSNNLYAIEITDDLRIEFDLFHSSQLCEVLIRNNTWKSFCLDAIEMDEALLTMCGGFNGKPMTIGPRGDLKLYFNAIFDSKKIARQTQICFRLGQICLRRTVAIQYRSSGSAIPKNEYDIPAALNDLVASQYSISRSEYNDALDQWVPSPDVDYAKHFHNLLYLEECGLRETIKRNYLQKEAFFGDQEYFMEDGKTIRKKYEPGIYDLQIKDLFEIRPSLQLGIQK